MIVSGYLRRLIFTCYLLSPRLVKERIGVFVLQRLGVAAGRGFLDRGCYVFNLDNLKLGDNSCLGPRCSIYNFAPVSIGRNCQFAAEVTILTGSHDEKNMEPSKSQISIGEGVWVGARVTVMPGVKIGDHAVIGAGSLVTKDIPDWAVAAGVPAKVLRKRLSSSSRVGFFGSYDV